MTLLLVVLLLCSGTAHAATYNFNSSDAIALIVSVSTFITLLVPAAVYLTQPAAPLPHTEGLPFKTHVASGVLPPVSKKTPYINNDLQAWQSPMSEAW